MAAAAPASLPRRCYRLLRLFLHLLQGVATTALVFPMVAAPRRQALVRRWSVSLLAILCAELRVNGWPVGGLAGNVLIVANHISWLDIVVLNAVQPSRFVAKADLARWPAALSPAAARCSSSVAAAATRIGSITTPARHRRHLARQAEEVIRQVLASPASGPAPGRVDGRRVSVR